jgi:prepilin-type N-terminal cleavage/methylation domain-containing protein
MTRTSHNRPLARAGFSLVELLVVIFIISILIAILLPALGAVRASGRLASTSSLLTNLNQAAASFELDNRRQPGFFAANELGSNTNFNNGAGPGLTQMENALLDLSGGDAISETQPTDLNGWLEVNPSGDPDRAIWVQPALLGASEGSYFLPGAASLVAQSPAQQPGAITQQSAGGTNGIPDLVDSFGQPIIAWVQNSAAPRTIRESHQFATLSVEDSSALFYWAANGSILSSRQLGERGRDMGQTPVAGQTGSLIGAGARNIGEAQIEGVMGALLGHPGYPDEALLATGDYDNIYPTRPRGAFIAHSAGPDGIFLGADDNRVGRLIGSDMLGGGNLNITYGVNFFSNTGGDRRLGDNNQPETVDFIDAFDDLVVSQ